jgi:plastocyanin
MSNETLFYVFGIGLAISAVLFSFAGLKLKDFPGRAFPIVVLWFTVLVGGAATFAVLHAKDEEQEKSAELKEAGKEYEKETSSGPFEGESDEPGEAEAGEQGGAEAEPEAGAEGPGGTLKLAASPTDLKYDTTTLASKPGKVTIDFDNPSAIEHDVAIELDGEEIGGSDLVKEAETSVSVDLTPGSYTFFCTVPGHAEAGMEGTLTVK